MVDVTDHRRSLYAAFVAARDEFAGYPAEERAWLWADLSGMCDCAAERANDEDARIESKMAG